MSMTTSDIKIRIDLSHSLISELKSLIKKGIKYYLVSFVVVLTATTYLLQLWGDNQPVFMGPQFSTVFR